MALVVTGAAVGAAASYKFGRRSNTDKPEPMPSENAPSANASPVVQEPTPTFRDVFRELGLALRLAVAAAAAAWTAFHKFARVRVIAGLLTLIFLAAVATIVSSEIPEAIHLSHSAPAWAAWFSAAIVVAGWDHILRIVEYLILVARWAVMKPHLAGLSLTVMALMLGLGLPAS